MQYRGNLPEVFKMRDLNEDANDCWPQHHNEVSSECQRSTYHLCKTLEYTEYDKEMFKRTMLEHEAIFRKQVYELHRLYRIQKNMMEGMKADASNSNSSSSQIHFVSANKSFPAASSTANNNMKPHLCFINGSSGYKERDMLNYNNHNALPKRTLDPQLPACTYLDRKELGSSRKENIVESSSVTTRALNGCSTQSLTDLNEPAKNAWLFGKPNGSVYDKLFLGSPTSVADNHCVSFPVRSDTSFSVLPNAFLKTNRSDVVSSSNSFLNEAVTNKISSSMKSFSPLSKEKSPMPYVHLQQSRTPQENSSWNSDRSDKWYKPKYESSLKVPLFGYTSSPSPSHAKSFLDSNGTSSSYNNGFHSSKSRAAPVPPFYHNSFNHGTGLDLNSKNDINHEVFVPQKLNKDMHLNNGFLNGFQTAKKDDETDVECQNLSWLRKKATPKTSCIMELDLSQGYPQLKTVVNNPKHDKLQEEVENHSSSVQFSSSELNNTRTKSNKLFGFHITEKNQQSDALSARQEVFQTNDLSVGDGIDLNIDLNCSEITEPEMIETHTKVSGIDLEAPIIIDKEVAKHDETTVKQAAESIILLSSHESTRLDALADDPCDTLHLLAEIVSSSNIEKAEEIYKEEAVDSFEQMTMNLEECKSEESVSWSGDVASVVCRKPRRGQARKRRKKDFQTEILPGLASLSRKEVSEDLQSIGVTTTKRRAGRKLKKNGNENNADALQLSCPPDNNLNRCKGNNERETTEGINLIGWGRTTRRCRRQRFTPITNVTAALT